MPAIPVLRTRDTAQYTHAGGQTFLDGAFVVAAAGVMSECGANPASIFGFALEPATFDPQGATIVQVQRLQEGNKFWIPTTSDGTTPQAPVVADIGATFGITKGTDSIWTLDRSKNAANQRLVVHNIDTVRLRAECSVLAANRQIAP